MHSTEDLRSDSFTITVDGEEATFSDLFPDFDESDRLGAIVHSPCGGLGASALILATVTKFYDFQRARSDDFFVYPDYFLFHVNEPLGDHNMLDIWPGHKEVVVRSDPEEILQAMNDRAITRLLVVEDVEPEEAEFQRETRAGTKIVSALAYSSQGTVENADVRITGNGATESYVSAVLEQSQEIDEQLRDGIRHGRERLLDNGAPTETYRRLNVEEALNKLT